MARKSKWLPNNAGTRAPLSGNREPGAEHDYMARQYLEGPAVTPLGDVLSGAVLVAGAVLVLLIPLGFAASTNVGVIAIVVVVALIFLGGAFFVIRRGVRRWAWRKNNVERTGGVYLKPWKRTPDAYRGGGR